MRVGARAVFAVVLALAAPAAARPQDSPPAPPPPSPPATTAPARPARPAAERVAEARLPALGLVGDLPPETRGAVLDITRDGRVHHPSVPGTWSGYGDLLGSCAVGPRSQDPLAETDRNIVLRVDRDAPWSAVREVLDECERLALHRVFFAARPAAGGEAGAMALFLPAHRTVYDDGEGAAGPMHGTFSARPILVVLDPWTTEGPPTAAALEAHTAPPPRGRGPWKGAVLLDALPGVRAGAVLEAADVLLRRGCEALHFGSSRTAPVAPEPRPGDARPRIVYDGDAVGPPGDAAPATPPARVTGGFAGQALPPALLEESPRDRWTPAPGRFPPIGEVQEAALDWLARHQGASGAWDADGFDERCRAGKCTGRGAADGDVAVTSLAVLAFLGTGATHKSPRHGKTVRDGLRFLKASQDVEGGFGPRRDPRWMRGHAMATFAMAEAYARTESPLFKGSAQRGVDFLLRAREPYSGWCEEWRATPCDTVLTAWATLALVVARGAGLRVPQEALDGALAAVDHATDPATGRVGRRGPPVAAPAPPGALALEAGLFVRAAVEAEGRSPATERLLALVEASRPVPEAAPLDLESLYFAALGARLASGPLDERLRAAADPAIERLRRSEAAGECPGSLDPVGPCAAELGRVGMTALGCLVKGVPRRLPHEPSKR